MRLSEAKEIAIKIGTRLQPFCNRLNIAGSIRRQKPDVKDIELVCLPRYIDASQESLFADVIVEKVISQNFVEVIKSLGKIIKGKPDGRYMQIQLHQRINLDLFMPDSDDYYRQYAIRTGSADYAARTIATAWRRKGWCGSDKGLRLMKDCIEHKQVDGKSKWVCMNDQAERPPVWGSEQEFFDWLEVPMIMPKLRII
jgi:DNA polymerase/3'-5' exonuclease PolX